jgi:hypothetical protein
VKRPPRDVPEYSAEFLEFCDAYGEDANDGAWRAWCKVCNRTDFPGLNPLLARLDEWQSSDQWRRGYLPALKKYLRDGYWQRRPPKDVPKAQGDVAGAPRPTTVHQLNQQNAKNFAHRMAKRAREAQGFFPECVSNRDEVEAIDV